MRAFVSAEDEQFKLKINAEDKTIHNFRPHTHKINLTACRNSFAAFQLLMQCDCRVCVNLDDSPWFSEYDDAELIYIRHSGQLTPAMNHVGMHLGDDGNLYADSLEGSPVNDVEADTPTAVFIRFEIPKDLPVGQYSGEFRIYSTRLFAEESYIDKILYTLDVHAVTLPDPHDGCFYLDLWQHNCNIARKAEVAVWSDRHFEIIEKYVKTLGDLGQHTVTAVVSEIPWSGQRCFLDKETTSNLFEYSMISVECDEKGRFHYDYSVLDRYVELCFKYGINREIEVFGLINNWISVNDGYYNFTDYPDAIRIRYRTPDGTHLYIKKSADIENYIKGICEHFEEKGWLDIVRVVADEPADHEGFRLSMGMLRRITPKFRYKAAIMRKTFYDDFKDVIDDFCLTLTGISAAFDEWKEVFRKDKKHKFTYYVCCFPEFPNTFLSSSLAEARYITILADYLGFDGFLRWNYTVWPKDPRRDIRCSMWPAGDTNFVYPAGDMSPLLTLRYMALRRGIEDYELLHMLRREGKTDAVEEVHRVIIKNTDFTSFYHENSSRLKFEMISTSKFADYQKIRIQMYTALDENYQ